MIVQPLRFFVDPKSIPIKSKECRRLQRSHFNAATKTVHRTIFMRTSKLCLLDQAGNSLPFPPLWTSIGFYHPRPSRNTNNKQWRPFFSALGRQSELYSRDRAVATSKTCFKLSPTDSLCVHPSDKNASSFSRIAATFFAHFQRVAGCICCRRETT